KSTLKYKVRVLFLLSQNFLFYILLSKLNLMKYFTQLLFQFFTTQACRYNFSLRIYEHIKWNTIKLIRSCSCTWRLKVAHVRPGEMVAFDRFKPCCFIIIK